MRPASESEAARAIKLLEAAIRAAEHGNQNGEDLVVQAAMAIGFKRDRVEAPKVREDA